MSTELVSALDATILDAYERFIAAMRSSCDKAVEAANARIECGLNLIKRKDNTPHGEWLKLFRSAKGKVCEGAYFEFPFDQSTASRWMSLAKRHPNPFTSAEEVEAFHQLMGQEARLLPKPEGHGEQSPGPSASSALIKRFGGLDSAVDKHNALEVIRSWSQEEKEVFVPQYLKAWETMRQIGVALGVQAA